jgi:hypothetical protein
MRLIKLPETFEVQYCKMAGVRPELFERLLKILDVTGGKTRSLELLDVVRPLCIFAAELTTLYAKNKAPITHRRCSAIGIAISERARRIAVPGSTCCLWFRGV